MITDKLIQVFEMNNELMSTLSDEKLKLTITNVRSNTIGSQIACILQARDAYGKSIVENRGFTWAPDFPAKDRHDISKVISYATTSSNWLITNLKTIDEYSSIQESLLHDLIAHEYLHQGQLIRYFYANDLAQPNKVKSFWHLED